MSSSFDTEQETPEFDNLAKLAENLVYRLPGCSDLMVRKTLQEVYRDFCRRSCCLRVRRQFTISKDDSRVVLPSPLGGVIDCVVRVKVDGRCVRDKDWKSVGCVVELSPWMLPCEGNTRTVEVEGVEVPPLNCEVVPMGFVESHGDALCSGSLARLFAMQGRMWANPQQAADERIAYENAIGVERMKLYSGRDDNNTGIGVNYDELI